MELSEVPIPQSLGKSLHACMCCCLVKDFSQFFEQGCENCPFLEMVGDRSRVQECTTAHFSGLAAIIRPNQSWCSKWLRLNGCIPGVYALNVQEVSQTVVDICDTQGIPLRRPE
eukprot:TRINITY_DN666_c0_g1_i1.p3 TRINITY_DN666_c0_g1~~TRINITY_DN666_c0_g1_i1.p3  ORF type:complete len:114 (+),score=12.81 TRINITY_DN666_c0_g1_i1:94-435(+)